ncbi:MAG: hypothetical protein QGH60_04315 [Phycisphaerae bacterium]|jgi:hypothetical protein|nr:hypothetical protein [Phycisphaerae bacterium]
MTPETDSKTASLSEKVKVFMTKIVTDQSAQAGRQDVLDNIHPNRLAAARRTYAQAMTDAETPLAAFLDFKHRKGTRGILITDRYIYSSHTPVRLPLDRLSTIKVTGGGFTPEKLRINGVAVLVHRTIDSLAKDILTQIRSEIKKRKLDGKLIGEDAARAALTNESYVRAAAEDIASGSAPAAVQAQLQGRGMDEESAGILARGLLALSEPGNIASGAGLVLTGFLCMVLVAVLLIAPMTNLIANPVFIILGAVGALVITGIGVQNIRSVKKRRTDSAGLIKAWLDFLDADRTE